MRPVEVAIAAVAVLGVGTAVVVAPEARTPVPVEENEPPPSAPVPAAPVERNLDSLGRVTVTSNPFRAARAAAAARYGTGAVPESLEAPDAVGGPDLSALVVTGIVWGPHPTAVVEGLPGFAEPMVVSVGDTVAGFAIRLIGRDSVVVAGRDTTFILTVSEVWQ